MNTCPLPIGPFIIRALCFIFSGILRVFIFYYYYPLCIQLTFNGPVAKACMHWLAGPGFESQVPILFVIIFFQVIQCLSKRAVHDTPSFQCLPDGPRPDLVVHIGGPPYSQVNGCTWDLGKSIQANVNGPQKLPFSPLFQAQTS